MEPEKYCLNCGATLENNDQFCPVCGSKVQLDEQRSDEGMKTQELKADEKEDGTVRYCTNCGEALEEGAVFCPNCGERVSDNEIESEKKPYAQNVSPRRAEQNDNKQRVEKLNALKGTAIVSAKKVVNSAQGLVEKVNEKAQEAKDASDKKLEEEIKKQQRETEKKQRREKDNSQQYMSKKELWSWLKQSSKRQHFYTEQVSELTEEEYFSSVREKLDSNLVPAEIERRDFQWDRSSVHRKDYIVKPLTKYVNPLSCLVQFSQIGKFIFVEEKIFITPPDLPPVPLKKKPFDPSLINKLLSLILWGVGFLIVGLLVGIVNSLGYLAALIGGVLLIVGFVTMSKLRSIGEYNKKCEEMEIAWENAWNNWRDSIFVHSFQEDINGQVSRIYDAVFECIKQVNEELFKATAVAESSENSNLNELEELITRRKQEYR